jgi:hypothetical protein
MLLLIPPPHPCPQVFLDKATKGGWVLLARQHGVQLADLTPLQPLFERLERPPLALTHTWPTPQADEAVVQVRSWGQGTLMHCTYASSATPHHSHSHTPGQHRRQTRQWCRCALGVRALSCTAHMRPALHRTTRTHTHLANASS